MSDRRRTLHQSAYYVVETIHDERIVRITRLNRPFESLEDTNAACRPVHDAVDGVGRNRACVLIDSRIAPARNDPTYESWFSPHRVRMVAGVRRAAVLMGSAIGMLHAERVKREDRMQVGVRFFTDEPKAIDWLLELATPPREK